LAISTDRDSRKPGRVKPSLEELGYKSPVSAKEYSVFSPTIR